MLSRSLQEKLNISQQSLEQDDMFRNQSWSVHAPSNSSVQRMNDQEGLVQKLQKERYQRNATVNECKLCIRTSEDREGKGKMTSTTALREVR